jgi:dTDP-4-amino-4,6-dideoxygalactose transaminase
VFRGHISGNGIYTRKVQEIFSEKYKIRKSLLTNSCTDALEMAALLLNIQPGDEVIVPSFTFVSTANAFILRGAKIVFIDSEADFPNMDVNNLEELITEKTKAIVPVHYAGAACEMNKILQIAKKYDLRVIEDAAQGIHSYYEGKALGSIGDLGTLSFHETKNIQCGEGGLLMVNNPEFIERSEIIWEKGTNRAAFYRGEVDKYNWVDIGSSFLPTDMAAAFLYAQMQEIESIIQRRVELWGKYYSALEILEKQGDIRRPTYPEWSTNNGHMFFILTDSVDTRDNLIKHLKARGIVAVFHYQSLHKSPYFKSQYKGSELINADYFSDQLLRLPMYYGLTNDDLSCVVETINEFYKGKSSL